MKQTTFFVKNAGRMMVSVNLTSKGIRVTFGDGKSGYIPYSDIDISKGLSDITKFQLPNPYELKFTLKNGRVEEIPWDFARDYCDQEFSKKVEDMASIGRQTLGERIRKARTKAGMTQESLASVSGVGRVTLVRMETGEQSPRIETLVRISKGLGAPLEELLVGEESSSKVPA